MNAPEVLPVLTSAVVSGMISEALEHTNDKKEAATIVLEKLRSDRKTYKAVRNTLVGQMIDVMVDKECSARRAAAWKNTEAGMRASNRPDEAARMRNYGRRIVTVELLMMYQLSKGPIGEYDRDMLREESARYKSQAKSMTRTAFWLDAIWTRLPEHAKVKEIMSEDVLRTLQEEAILAFS